ncbi:MAG: aldehyde reductase, partial [Pseudomonadota bacterium]
AATNTLAFVELGRILKKWDSSLKAPTREMPSWLVRILGRFMPDLKPILASLGRNLAVSGSKAERVFGFKFIPAEDAIIASAESIKKYKA